MSSPYGQAVAIDSNDSGSRFEHFQVLLRDGKPVELGRGGMGVTYKAIDTNLGTPVALKVINQAYLDSELMRLRFVAEARAAAGLRHPNVASVFHLGKSGKDYFYAMELVEGERLDRILRFRGPLETGLVLKIADQIAAALSAALPCGPCCQPRFPSKAASVKYSRNRNTHFRHLRRWNTFPAQWWNC